MRVLYSFRPDQPTSCTDASSPADNVRPNRSDIVRARGVRTLAKYLWPGPSYRMRRCWLLICTFANIQRSDFKVKKKNTNAKRSEANHGDGERAAGRRGAQTHQKRALLRAPSSRATIENVDVCYTMRQLRRESASSLLMSP